MQLNCIIRCIRSITPCAGTASAMNRYASVYPVSCRPEIASQWLDCNIWFSYMLPRLDIKDVLCMIGEPREGGLAYTDGSLCGTESICLAFHAYSVLSQDEAHFDNAHEFTSILRNDWSIDLVHFIYQRTLI